MKQMRSRFRLLTLLLVCAFLLTLVLCAGHVLKTAGISLSSLSLSLPGTSGVPVPAVTPDASPAPELSPAPSEHPPEVSPAGLNPGTDNPPQQEYNVTGL